MRMRPALQLAIVQAGVRTGERDRGAIHDASTVCSDDRRHRATERGPSGTVLPLTLHEDVARLVPWKDYLDLVVKDEVAAIGSDHEDGVALALFIDDDGHAEGAA